MRRRVLILACAVIAVGLAVFWWVTRPVGFDAPEIAGITPDPARGEYVFRAAGCASCHIAPDAEAGALELVGGKAFASPFGTFYAPNISPHPDYGIGRWSALDLVNALKAGVSPEGEHYYPALPYASYAKMTTEDAVSLFAYLQTLPQVAAPSKPHEVPFPFSWRRLLGGWKFLFLDRDWAVASVPPGAETGRYLAEALTHCGECHTPRSGLGAMDKGRWLAGGPMPGGTRPLPNLTPGGLDWSEADLMTFLQTGFTPEFDVVGGDMALVSRNLATLPEADLVSLVAYLKAVPAVAKLGE